MTHSGPTPRSSDRSEPAHNKRARIRDFPDAAYRDASPPEPLRVVAGTRGNASRSFRAPPLRIEVDPGDVAVPAVRLDVDADVDGHQQQALDTRNLHSSPFVRSLHHPPQQAPFLPAPYRVVN